MRKQVCLIALSVSLSFPMTVRTTHAGSPAQVPKTRTESTTELVAVEGWPASHESHADAAGLPVALEGTKFSIVGSWLGSSGEGNRIIQSYTADGVVLASVQGEVSTNPGFGAITPAHGVWTYLGRQQFAVTAKSILYDINTGEYLGYLKARLLLTMSANGNEMNGTDRVEIFGPDGSLVFAAPPGSTSFTRIRHEPFD
jgi:hypothetical protein